MLPKKKVIVSPLAQIKELENDPKLKSLVEQHLPPNYDFEVAKTVWRIRKTEGCKTVALQLPEGLLLFATKLAAVIEAFTGVDTVLMGDITYGACCIDDFTAKLLGADLLVHYGHSCLVPTSVASRIETIYIFVTIKLNTDHAVTSIESVINDRLANGPSLTSSQQESSGRKHLAITQEQDNDARDEATASEKPILSVSLVSTIQFAYSLPIIKKALEESPNVTSVKLQMNIPRSKPLSNGEILGCTAPTVKDDLIFYVGDGRFHLEAMMMANPGIEAFRYDPYNKTVTLEGFDHTALHTMRGSELTKLSTADRPLTIGIILGTLGRQGNPKPCEYVYQKLSEKHNCFILLMSEVMPAKLQLFPDVDVWVQFACPRLSIDWGTAFNVPIVTPYEAIWGLQQSCCGSGNKDSCSSTCTKEAYTGHPMDYYAYDSLGPHTPNFMPPKPTAKPR